MTAKNKYEVGESVWIAGVSYNNARLTKGQVVKILDMSEDGYSAGPYYVIAIPTEIDDLLEIRTWETMSEDSKGPVGAFRNLNLGSTVRFINQTGFETADDFGDPTPEQIHAAIEKSIKDVSHTSLNLKSNGPRRRNFTKKKKS